METSMRSRAAAARTRMPARRRARAMGLAGLAGILAAVGAAGPAHAAGWGYEQITPAEGSNVDVYGVGVSADSSTVVGSTWANPMGGQDGDGRSGIYGYAFPRGGSPWLMGPLNNADTQLNLIGIFRDISPDGTQVLFRATMPSVFNGFNTHLFRADGTWAHFTTTSPDYSNWRPHLNRMAFRTSGSNGSVYVNEADGTPVAVAVDGNGDPVSAALGGAQNFTTEPLHENAYAEDGSSVIFTTSTDLVNGDNDPVTGADVYMRILSPGPPRTVLISDNTDNADPDAGVNAEYRWATADHDRVVWRSAEAYAGTGDTDNAQDLFVRLGEGPIIRVTQGETVDGSPTGNAAAPVGDAEFVGASEDGDRIYFVSRERLTQQAPADTSVYKLYERDLSENVTRFVAGPLAAQDVGSSYETTPTSLIAITRLPSYSKRPVRVTSTGIVFLSAAQLAGDGDDKLDLFRWTRNGGLELLSKPEPGAPASASADAVFPSVGHRGGQEFDPFYGGRGTTADGDRVFFSTTESLVAEDTDGGWRDVYVWEAGKGVRLVSPPGDAPYHATYFGSNADGTEVFFNTAETILPSDLDPNAVDIYVAIEGGGSAPGKPAPDPVPAGPGAPAGAPPQVPSLSGPVSSSSKGPEGPAPVIDAGGGGDDGPSSSGRASLRLRASQGAGGSVVVRVSPSSAGALRVRAKARLGKRSRVVGSLAEEVEAGSSRLRLELSEAALARLRQRGSLQVRVVARLSPSGGERPVRARVTVKLRSGERRS
jgi:hypothetical protein